MDKKEFIKKWLPTDGALEEEFRADVEALCETEFDNGMDSGMESAKATVRDWYEPEPQENEGYL